MKKLYLGLLILVIAVVAIPWGITAYGSYERENDRARALKQLQSGDYDSALMQLIDSGDERDIASIIPLLENEDPNVRFHAAEALGKLSGHAIPIPTAITDRSNFNGPDWVGYYNLSDTKLVEQYISEWREWAQGYISQQAESNEPANKPEMATPRNPPD